MRDSITTSWERRPWIGLTAVDPIQTGVWDDTQTWDETNKYWLDWGTTDTTQWTRRTTITTNWA